MPRSHKGLISLPKINFGRHPIHTFRYSLIKGLILLLFALILAASALLSAIFSVTGLFLALLLSFVFLICMAWATRLTQRLIDRGPVVNIGAEGIIDRRVSSDMIPWSDIDDVYLFRSRSQRYIAVVVADPSRHASPLHWADKLSLWMNKRIGMPQFSISLMGLNASPGRIFLAVMDHLPERYDRGRINR